MKQKAPVSDNVRRSLLAFVVLLALLLASAWVFSAEAQDGKTTFTAERSGEATLDLTALAPGTDWAKAGGESAVVTIRLDGKYNQDVVLFAGARRFTYEVALGRVGAGRHTVEVLYNDAKSPRGARGVEVEALSAEVVADDAATVARYSPILYGRNLAEVPGRYENNRTDVPMLMYHTRGTEQATGNTTIEYTIIWSNEDGGTDTPGLMARYGRSTDIEWVYRVTLGPGGTLLKEEYQGPGHQTLPFAGAKMGDHPLLVTQTSNNNFVPVADPSRSTGYRFFLDPSRKLPAGRAREVMMDRNPWTYPIMAKELVREGKIERPADPATNEVSDQRNYLYLEFDKDTTPQNVQVGTAIVVKLKGTERRYTSHHNVSDQSVTRDDPAATTVELPPGTDAGDVREVRALAVPVNPDGASVPRDYRVSFQKINRAFFLNQYYRPEASFIRWQGSVTLTPERREAVVWRAGQ